MMRATTLGPEPYITTKFGGVESDHNAQPPRKEIRRKSVTGRASKPQTGYANRAAP